MEKIASNQYSIHPLLQRRWSPCIFSDRPIESEKLASILEAARWAPSSYNEQPWSFIIATQSEPIEYNKMLNCLVPFNQTWAKTAPVLMITVAHKYFSHDHSPNPYGWHDVGLAVENMTIQAMTFDIFVHQMGGFNATQAIATYEIPDTHQPVSAIALGYMGEMTDQPAELQERQQKPRDRKPLSDFVFTGTWQKSRQF
jgi:nitroreductase